MGSTVSTPTCRPELVSGPMPRWQAQTSCTQPRSSSEAWMLKQVQHDDVLAPAFALNQTPLNSKVTPFRIVRLNQIDFPLPMPPFQLLFARNRVGHRFKRLGTNKPNCAIVSCKSWRRASLVLPKPRGEVRRYADVDCSSLLAGENVGARLSTAHSKAYGEAWMLKQVQHDVKRQPVVLNLFQDPCLDGRHKLAAPSLAQAVRHG
jgi:hypothetical protein